MTDPCELQFRLLATRRYMLDNELTISELVHLRKHRREVPGVIFC